LSLPAVPGILTVPYPRNQENPVAQATLRIGVPVVSMAALLMGPLLVPEPASAQDGPSYETTRIDDGIYAFRWNFHNAFFVVAPEGVVVVDPISEDAARQLAEEIRAVAPDAALRAIVYSHDHADHATGANALRAALGSDAPIIAHEAAAPKVAARDDAALPAPDITYASLLTLGSSERSVELHFLGRSHSDNMTVVLVPEQRVAFAVDFVSHDRVGFRELPGYHFPEFFETLGRLAELEFDTIVFGHGPAGDHSSIERQIAYYGALREAVEAAVAEGLSEDETAQRVRLEAYADWGQFEDWGPLNVRAIHRWVSSR
jgi:glyoxylase-like metal-dependent hydrolase (beta-lactamase superfamily II)